MMAPSILFSSRQIGLFAAIVLLAAAGGTAYGSQESSVAEAPSPFADGLALTLLQGGSVVDKVLDDSVSRCMAEQGFEIDAISPIRDDGNAAVRRPSCERRKARDQDVLNTRLLR